MMKILNNLLKGKKMPHTAYNMILRFGGGGGVIMASVL